MVRNSALAPNVNKLSKSQLYKKKGSHKRSYPTKETTAPVVEFTPKAPYVQSTERGAPELYPADDSAVPKKSRKNKTVKVATLRASITPGTVLILLAGRFRGKRVVFLKQLESGLLLVSGPFKVNGVPLRRVNQAYVIATSTKIDISSVSIDAKFADSYFSKPASSSTGAKSSEFFQDGKKAKEPLPSSKSDDQKAIDGPLIAAIKADKVVGEKGLKYLASTWGLSKGQAPHLLKF